jgi:predicted MPP superfamily phosphohydrolase
MKWLHISDIHYDQINDGIHTRMLHDDFEKYTKEKRILVDEVFFTGDFRHAKNQKKQDVEIVAKEAVDFLRYIASCVGVTSNDHIHIVPGNHDLDCGDLENETNEELKRLNNAIGMYNDGNFIDSASDYLRSRFLNLSYFLCKWKISSERNPFISKLNGELV